jgi:hypothetical protein
VVNVLPAKSEALTTAARAAKLPAEQRSVATCWLQLVYEAVKDDECAAAIQFAEKAQAAARKSNDEVLLKLIVNGSQELPELQAAHDAAMGAKERLLTNPDDLTACRLWGRFLCAYKGQWDEGLPFWAQGDAAADDDLQAIVQSDLAGPKDAAAQSKLGDQWWDAAAKEEGALPRRVLQNRAMHWYRQAVGRLSDSQRALVEARIAEFDEAHSPVPRGKWVNVLATVDLDTHRVKGDWSWRADALGISRREEAPRIMIPVAPQGSYDLEVRFSLEKETDEVSVILPVGDRMVMQHINAWLGTISGLQLIDGRHGNENATTVKHPPLAPGKPHKLEIHVDVRGEQGEIEVELDGRKLTQWQGARSSLSLPPVWTLPKPGALGIATWNSAIVVHSVRLKTRTGVAKLIDD